MFDIGVVRVPEGFIQFCTVVVRREFDDMMFATNVVVGADFDPDWNDPSDQLTEFDETVLPWVNGLHKIARDLYHAGYILVIEDGDELATDEIIHDLD